MEDLEKLNRNLTIYSDLIDKTNRFINNLDTDGTYFIRDLKDSFPLFSSFPDDGVVDIDTLISLRKWLEAKKDKIDSEIMRIKVQSIKSKRDEIPLQVSSVNPDSSVKKSVVSNNNQVSRESEVKYLPEEVLNLGNLKRCEYVHEYLNSLGSDIKKYKKVIIKTVDGLKNIDFHGLDVDFFHCNEFRSLDGVYLGCFSNVGLLNISSSNLKNLYLEGCSLKDFKIPQSVKDLTLDNVKDIENLELPSNLEELCVWTCSVKGLKIPQSVKELSLYEVSDIENLKLPLNLEYLKVRDCSVKGLEIPQSVKKLDLDSVSDIENLELPSNLEELKVRDCSVKELEIPQSVKKLDLFEVSVLQYLDLSSNQGLILEVWSCSDEDLKILESIPLNVEIDYRGDDNDIKEYLDVRKKRIEANNFELANISGEILDLRNLKSSEYVSEYLNSLGTDIKKYKKVVIETVDWLADIDFHGLDVDFHCEDFHVLSFCFVSNVGQFNILSSNLYDLGFHDCSVKGIRIPQSVKRLDLENVSNLENLELPSNLEELHLSGRNLKIRKIPANVKNLNLYSMFDFENSELPSNLNTLTLWNSSVKGLKIPQGVKMLSLLNVRDLENLELPLNLENLEVKCCSVKGLKILQSVKRLSLYEVSDIENLELLSNLEYLKVQNCSVKGLKIPQSVKELNLYSVSDLEYLDLSLNLEYLNIEYCSAKDLKMLESIPLNVEIDYRGDDNDIKKYLADREEAIRANISELFINSEELLDLRNIGSCEYVRNYLNSLGTDIKKYKKVFIKTIDGLKNIDFHGLNVDFYCMYSDSHLSFENIYNVGQMNIFFSNLENLEVKCCSVKGLKIPQSVKKLILDSVSNIENLKLPSNLEELKLENCSVKGLIFSSSLERIIFHDVKDLDLRILESIPLNVEIDYRGDDNDIKKYLDDRKEIIIANNSITSQLESVSEPEVVFESSQIADSVLAENIEKKKKSKSFIVKLFQGITRNQGKNKK